MAYVPLSRFLLRAPLLPIAALRRPDSALLTHELGARALALASPALIAAGAPDKRKRAVGRYGRRAAFRATPQGLLAGVMMGTLGENTRIRTGKARACLALAWGRAAALGRALLDDPEVRASARLRFTPSLVRGAGSIRWLADGELREAELDDRLARILDATAEWTAWTALRRAAAQSDEDDEADADDLLLLLIDDGLLSHDLAPPLVGPPPLDWMARRLGDVGSALDGGKRLVAIAGRLNAGDLAGATGELRALPGADEAETGVHGVLVFDSDRPMLDAAAVKRAAGLAPLLFRLQEALAAPAAERLLRPALGEALTAVTETVGAGALDLAGLSAGDYGVELDDDGPPSGEAPPVSPPPALVTLLLDRITATLVAGGDEAAFSSTEIAGVLDDVGPPPPPTAELFLIPCRSPRGAPAGTGWLLGQHAPAGASWGRFAAALGAPMADALAELARAEQTHLPDVELLDVGYAPSPALGDLCQHPPLRGRTLALTGWPDGPHALTLADLQLCADPNAPAPLALRTSTSTPVAPSPLSRIRSTTAPGVYQLLAGWSLYRQHAPWALALGPLAQLARLPRISVDGFVVSPASWRLPPAAQQDPPRRLDRRTLGRWRRQLAVPRLVQVGREDQLLPVDLTTADAAADLSDADRVWEIWPPLDDGVDRDGRRVEAVIALVDQPDKTERARQAATAQTIKRMDVVPPPHITPPAVGWKTFKLFGPASRQDDLLAGTVAPAMRDALAAAEIDAWFFIRYIDGPGRRPHLRLRAHAANRAGEGAFTQRLEHHLRAARQAAHVITVETSDYFPEHARFGGETAFPAVSRIFQSDSELTCQLLALEEPEPIDPLGSLVRSMDALTAGLGFSLAQRHQIALERRRAASSPDAPAEQKQADDRDYRTRAPRLREALRTPDRDTAGRLLIGHRDRVAAAMAEAALPAETREALPPPLLHLAAVRLCGTDADVERRACVLWQRALEGLLSSRRPP